MFNFILFLVIFNLLYNFFKIIFNIKTDINKKIIYKVTKKPDIIYELAIILNKYIKLPNNFKKNLANDLKILNISDDVNIYVCKELIKSSPILIFSIFVFFINKKLSILYLATFFLSLYDKYKKIKNKISERNEFLDREILNFANFILENLKITTNIQNIFENYLKYAKPILQKEILLTVSQMQNISDLNTDAQIIALENLNNRNQNKMFEEIIRSLIDVKLGIYDINSFRTIVDNLNRKDLLQLKEFAKKQPSKINKYIYLLFINTMIIVTYVLMVDLSNSFKVFFN